MPCIYLGIRATAVLWFVCSRNNLTVYRQKIRSKIAIHRAALNVWASCALVAKSLWASESPVSRWPRNLQRTGVCLSMRLAGHVTETLMRSMGLKMSHERRLVIFPSRPPTIAQSHPLKTAILRMNDKITPGKNKSIL